MILRPLLRPITSSPLHGMFGRETYPSGAILHFDATLDPYTEQTGGPHTFNYSIGNPQCQRQADGSYVDVGAKVAADFYGGERWVRSFWGSPLRMCSLCGLSWQALMRSKWMARW